jgi:hypothetical protein
MTIKTQCAEKFGTDYVYVADSSEIAYILASIPRWRLQYRGMERAAITAAMVLGGEAELAEIWLTEASRYFADDAKYTQVI